MNRFERRARIAALKRQQKEARRAKALTASEPAPEATPEMPPELEPYGAEQQANAAHLNRVARSKLPESGTAPDRVLEACGVTAGFGVAVSKGLKHISELKLDDDHARQMLVRAAHVLDDVICTVQEALQAVSPERRREAMAVLNAEPEPEPLYSTPQQRPRRGPDPVVTLMRIGMQAASLLRRIISKTNPGLGRLQKAA
ncbi:MAG: hypothetical protein IPK87_09275 [Planctomycetes bacterium]|nr:hypothetical protein [Planctomycetota bacterium]